MTTFQFLAANPQHRRLAAPDDVFRPSHGGDRAGATWPVTSQSNSIRLLSALFVVPIYYIMVVEPRVIPTRGLTGEIFWPSCPASELPARFQRLQILSASYISNLLVAKGSAIRLCGLQLHVTATAQRSCQYRLR